MTLAGPVSQIQIKWIRGEIKSTSWYQILEAEGDDGLDVVASVSGLAGANVVDGEAAGAADVVETAGASVEDGLGSGWATTSSGLSGKVHRTFAGQSQMPSSAFQ